MQTSKEAITMKSNNGIIRNAFYVRNQWGDTKATFWGRTQGANIEAFDYKESDDGKIIITEKDRRK